MLLDKKNRYTVEKDPTWGQKIIFYKQTLTKQNIHDISEVFVSIFTSFRLLNMIETIVRESYYFKEPEEVHRILELAQEIILHQDDHGFPTYKNKQLHQILQRVFREQIQQSDAFHYDSVVKFCLTPFKKRLIDEVGLVIDDFKREEEHQMIVQMIREYIENKDVIIETVHILQGRNFLMFSERGNPLTKRELKPLMERTPLYLFGLNTDEWNLAPLIAISPRFIYIYGDLSEPKTLTVLNVFQERVTVKPKHEFPFY